MDFFFGVIVVVIACVIGWFLLKLLFSLLLIGLRGAGHLFGVASEQGFIGLAVCLACFVFMFPIMAVISIIVGFLITPVAPDASEIEHFKRIASNSGDDYSKQEEALLKKLKARKSLGLELDVVEEELKELRDSKSA